jgi:hypothetical protein
VDEQAFRGVVPGTRVTFALSIANEGIAAIDAAIVVPVRLIVRGNFRSILAEVPLDIVAPAVGGEGC